MKTELDDNEFKTCFDSVSLDNEYCDTIIVSLDLTAMVDRKGSDDGFTFNPKGLNLFSVEQDRKIPVETLYSYEKTRLFEQAEQFFNEGIRNGNF